MFTTPSVVTIDDHSRAGRSLLIDFVSNSMRSPQFAEYLESFRVQVQRLASAVLVLFSIVVNVRGGKVGAPGTN